MPVNPNEWMQQQPQSQFVSPTEWLSSQASSPKSQSDRIPGTEKTGLPGVPPPSQVTALDKEIKSRKVNPLQGTPLVPKGWEPKVPKPLPPSSVGNFVSTVGGDIAGVPRGAYNMIAHPVDTAKAMFKEPDQEMPVSEMAGHVVSTGLMGAAMSPKVRGAVAPAVKGALQKAGTAATATTGFVKGAATEIPAAAATTMGGYMVGGEGGAHYAAVRAIPQMIKSGVEGAKTNLARAANKGATANYAKYEAMPVEGAPYPEDVVANQEAAAARAARAAQEAAPVEKPQYMKDWLANNRKYWEDSRLRDQRMKDEAMPVEGQAPWSDPGPPRPPTMHERYGNPETVGMAPPEPPPVSNEVHAPPPGPPVPPPVDMSPSPVPQGPAPQVKLAPITPRVSASAPPEPPPITDRSGVPLVPLARPEPVLPPEPPAQVPPAVNLAPVGPRVKAGAPPEPPPITDRSGVPPLPLNRLALEPPKPPVLPTPSNIPINGTGGKLAPLQIAKPAGGLPVPPESGQQVAPPMPPGSGVLPKGSKAVPEGSAVLEGVHPDYADLANPRAAQAKDLKVVEGMIKANVTPEDLESAVAAGDWSKVNGWIKGIDKGHRAYDVTKVDPALITSRVQKLISAYRRALPQ